MHFDPLVTNPGRLSILTSLCADDRQEFVRLRAATQLTDGNLTTHARKLATAGMVAIEKGERAGRCVTTIALTPSGRAALTRHVEQLTASVVARGPSTSRAAVFASDGGDWID